MPVARGDSVALTRALVAVDSRNPSLVGGAPGEKAIAKLLADVLRDWGFTVDLHEVAPGRPNVVARVGKVGGATLMFNGHLDVVDVVGMTHAAFEGAERDGRIWGRGSSDMKSGVAAMCAAAVRAADHGLAGEIIIAAVADEEFASLGTRALIASGVRADAAIVAEPTRLAIMPAHRGFVWVDLHVTGRAAHGSRWEIGVDAIRHAGLFLAELDRYDATTLASRNHPLVGRPSVHASLISGGSGMSTYPDRCDLSIERRTIPGETAQQVMAEVEELIDRVRLARPSFTCDVKMLLAQSPSDVAVASPIVRALSQSLTICAVPERIEGMSAWTDAALLNDAGIPAICFGPGDIALAHAAEEFVDRREIEDATAVLTELAVRWTSGNR
jgi:acetylornithine deacetylase